MSSNNEKKIFVGNVPFQCTKEEFEECFKHLEGFIGAEIINRFNSSFSRGFGFVTFNSEKNALSALNLKGVIFKDRILRLSEYNFEGNTKMSDQEHKNFIFIKNVPLEMTRDDIYGYFIKYGNVTRCFLNTDIKTGAPKGTAILEMDDANVIDTLLEQKVVTFEDGTSLELVKWNNKTKPKRKQADSTDVYRTAFNAGRSIGFKEGMLFGKKRPARAKQQEQSN